MEKKLFALTVGFLMAVGMIAQVRIDTLYYDKNWKGVDSKAFATYYRIMAVSDSGEYRKQFRDFYMSGELQAESDYVYIDEKDDSKSVFDGEWTNYYKSGKIAEQGHRKEGKYDGELIRYTEDGNILIHAFFKDDKLDGPYTEYSPDGSICVQMEYKDGEHLHDYYMISSKDGLKSKVGFSDDRPVYEAPTLEEQKTEYKSGAPWLMYDKNGIQVGMTNTAVRDYGKYYQLPIVVTNNSMYSIDFNPESVKATIINKKEELQALKVFSADEYLAKVQRRQNWDLALTAIAEGLAASSAGYAVSTTTSSKNEHTSEYSSTDYTVSDSRTQGGSSQNVSHRENASMTTWSFNGATAYQAADMAASKVATYGSIQKSDRAKKSEGYLKRTTLYPGETITGYINIERVKGTIMTIAVDVCGVDYVFHWNVENMKFKKD